MGNARHAIDIDKGDKVDEACAIVARKLDKDLVAHAAVAEAARKLFRIQLLGEA